MQVIDKKRRVLIIAGPTGVGESTVTKKTIEEFPIFKRLVTATTRAPRLNEQKKIDYYFFDKENFQKQIENGNIIEYTYIESRDTYYGSYRPDLNDKIKNGFNVIVNTDLVGAKYYKEKYNATTIFILPESLDSLRRRHLDRDPNVGVEELEKRMGDAQKEIDQEADFYDHQIVNEYGKLEETMNKVFDILRKENYLLEE